jgi:LuxR family maltose regulon positive regulatory protein
LSDRELEVLRLIDQGLSNSEIAAKLVLSTGTVKVHSHNIFSKLGVGSRTQAVNKARALGLI